jgi:hypothetical protein
VDQEAQLGFFAVRINVAAVSLHADDPPQDLVFSYTHILFAPRIVAKKKRVTNGN